MKYFYQFDRDSELGTKLKRLHRECMKAEEAAERYAKKMGAVAYYSQPSAFAGGVACLEFNKKVDEAWRFVLEQDGHKYYEPNCIVTSGCVPEESRFTPSDTAIRIYQKKPCGFREVQYLKTLREWAKIADYTLTGDKEKDEQQVTQLLQNRHYLMYMEFVGQQPPKKKENKTAHAFRRAVRAEQQRLKLPVVPVTAIYDLFQADTKEELKEPSTPTFFEFSNTYYVGLDYPCHHADMKEIPQQLYTYKKNSMLRAPKT